MRAAAAASLLVVLLLFVAVANSAPTNKRSTDGLNKKPTDNIIQQVIKALTGRDNMGRVIEYLEKTEQDLNEKLPALDPGNLIQFVILKLIIIIIIYTIEGKANEYTFLAPTSSAFLLAVPQDIANPFSYDKQLRHNVLLRHFIRRQLTKDDFEAKSLIELTMADNTLFKLEHKGGQNIFIEIICYFQCFKS